MSAWRGSPVVLAGVLAALAGAIVGLLVVLAAAGGAVWPFASGGKSASTATGHAAGLPGVSDPAPSPAPSVLPAAAPGAGPVPTTAGLAAALRKPLRSPALGPRVGMVVLDPVSGQTLFAQSGDQLQTPASTLKTVTAASVLHFVGPDARLLTRTVSGATAGEVVLVGGGDPTITVSGGPIVGGAAYPRVASLTSLARQTAAALKAHGLTSVRLVLDDSYFSGPRTGPGWLPLDLSAGVVSRVSALSLDEDRVSPGADARFPDPTAATGRAFVTALKRFDVRVTSTSRGIAPANATQLGLVSSPPVGVLVEHMLLTSDNDLAEALAHVAGATAGVGGSFAGGAAASNQTLAWLGIDATTATIVDGSGISRRNELDAALLAAVMSAPTRANRPELAAMLSGLPIAGVNGSLAGRFNTPTTTGARGQVRAKTGTLVGVQSLAGTVLDRDGRTLVFAVLADRASVDTATVRAALDRLAATLAACGCR